MAPVPEQPTAELSISIAGLTVGLVLPHVGWVENLRTRLGRFFTDATPELRVHFVLNPELTNLGEPRVEQDADGLHLRHDQFHGFLPPTGDATLTIYQASLDPIDTLYVMTVDSFLRLCFAQLLAARGGLMFHAAGVASGTPGADRGYVFFGPSGSGKTTVCEHSPAPRYVLCDEIVAVLGLPGGEVRVYGTPFYGAWGDGLAADVPLGEMFWLKQAPHNKRVALDPPLAVRGLLESAVTYDMSQAGLVRTLEAALSLVARVPVTQLEFEPKESLWETVLSPAATH